MMRWIALLAAVAAAISIPAFAHGEPSRAPGAIVARDFAFENPATNDSSVTINLGETVTFSYPSGSNFHNVLFYDAGPSSCTPSLPADPQGPGWAATCRFNAPGSYGFVCEAHSSMTGTVEVVGTATPTPTVTPTPSPTVTPTATPTPSPTASPTPTATPSLSPSPSPTATPTPSPSPSPTAVPTPIPTAAPQPTTAPPGPGSQTTTTTSTPTASGLRLARNQRGQVVRGSISVARAGSRIKVDILIKRKLVGSATKSAAAGTASFAVKLNAAAKRTLKRSGKLRLTVRVTVTPAGGAPFTATKPVTLKR